MIDRHVKPFTLNQRRSLCRQVRFGHREKNDWGLGVLPAPWAEGDLVFVRREFTHDRIDGEWGYFVVSAGFSIDEGDAWYFRVSNRRDFSSDRLHVAYAERSTWDHDANWMEGWELIETADPKGLALRNRLLLGGWTFTGRTTCPCCGQILWGDL